MNEIITLTVWQFLLLCFACGVVSRLTTDAIYVIDAIQRQIKRSKMMTYKPKVGDVVRWTRRGSEYDFPTLDGVVTKIYMFAMCRVRFKDGSTARLYADDLKLISRPEPSTDDLKGLK